MSATTAVNLGPLQERFGSLNGLKVAYVGERLEFAAALMELGASTGMEVWLAMPADARPEQEQTVAAEVEARAHGASIDVVSDLVSALRGAELVYSDEPVDKALRSLAAPNAVYEETPD